MGNDHGRRKLQRRWKLELDAATDGDGRGAKELGLEAGPVVAACVRSARG